MDRKARSYRCWCITLIGICSTRIRDPLTNRDEQVLEFNRVTCPWARPSLAASFRHYPICNQGKELLSDGLVTLRFLCRFSVCLLGGRCLQQIMAFRNSFASIDLLVPFCRSCGTGLRLTNSTLHNDAQIICWHISDSHHKDSVRPASFKVVDKAKAVSSLIRWVLVRANTLSRPISSIKAATTFE